MKLYTIKDVKIDSFSPPFCAHSNEIAVRMVKTDLIRNPSSDYFIHSDDFVLHCVGLFDDSTGVLSTVLEGDTFSVGFPAIMRSLKKEVSENETADS